MSDNVRKACEEAAKNIYECLKLSGYDEALSVSADEMSDLIEWRLAPVVSAERAAMREKCAQEAEKCIRRRCDGWARSSEVTAAIRAIPTDDEPEKENSRE